MNSVELRLNVCKKSNSSHKNINKVRSKKKTQEISMCDKLSTDIINKCKCTTLLQIFPDKSQAVLKDFKNELSLDFAKSYKMGSQTT